MITNLMLKTFDVIELISVFLWKTPMEPYKRNLRYHDPQALIPWILITAIATPIISIIPSLLLLCFCSNNLSFFEMSGLIASIALHLSFAFSDVLLYVHRKDIVRVVQGMKKMEALFLRGMNAHRINWKFILLLQFLCLP